MSAAPAATVVPAADAMLWTYRARCIRVIDGDTLVAEIDCGFGVRYEATVRIAGIDAPELPTPEGIAAADRLGQIVRYAVTDWPLRLRTRRLARGTGEARSFSRYVAAVYAVQSDAQWCDVAATMITDGHARPYPSREG